MVNARGWEVQEMKTAAQKVQSSSREMNELWGSNAQPSDCS